MDVHEAYPVVVGMAVGIAFILIFGAFASSPTANKVSPVPKVSVVHIVPGAVLQSNPKHFVPETINVTIGANNTVQWINEDAAVHTVISNTDYADPASGNFSTFAQLTQGYILPGKTFTFTFSQPGEYAYHSIPHPWMHGKVIVTAPRFNAGLNVLQICLPKDTSGLGFRVKQPSPTALPPGYELRAVEYNGAATLTMYFADHPMCRPGDRLTELLNGTIIMEISSGANFANETKMVSENTRIPLIDASGAPIPQQVVEINGHKAVVIPQHGGMDRVEINGSTIQQEALQMPAEVLLFRGDTSNEYFFTAQKPASVLVAMAESIR